MTHSLRETIARAIDPSMHEIANDPDEPPERREAAQCDLDRVTDRTLAAIRDAGLVIVPVELSSDMMLAGVVAMAEREEAIQARSPPDANDYQRGMSSGATMACNGHNLKAAYAAMIAAAPPLTPDTAPAGEE